MVEELEYLVLELRMLRIAQIIAVIFIAFCPALLSHKSVRLDVLPLTLTWCISLVAFLLLCLDVRQKVRQGIALENQLASHDKEGQESDDD